MENCNSEIPDVLHHKGNAEINLLSLVHASWIQFCAEKTFSFFAAIQLDQRWSPTASSKCCKFILLGITLINDYIVFNHKWKRKVLEAVRRDILSESSEGFSFQSMISQKFCFFQSGFLRKGSVTVCQNPKEVLRFLNVYFDFYQTEHWVSHSLMLSSLDWQFSLYIRLVFI